MKRSIALLLCLVMVLAILPVSASATQSRASNFKKNYTLTGVYGDDMVAVAAAQNKLVKSDLGYTEEWCADFVSDCARLAGVPNFPYHGGCTEMRRLLLAWGGVWHDYNDDYIPQKGDIIFYSDESFTDDDCDHVGLVYQSGFNEDGTVNTVEGNTRGVDANGDKSTSCVAIKTRPMITDFISDSGKPSKLYVLGYVTINQGMNSNPDFQSVPTRMLKYNGGAMPEGSDVVWVQMVLCALNYPVDIDGLYGSECTTTIAQFQRDHGLDDDGICGTATVAALNKDWLAKKQQTCQLSLTPPSEAVTVGEEATIAVSFRSDYAAKLAVSNSDDALCGVSLSNVDLVAGTAAIRLSPMATGTVEIRCDVLDQLGNVLRSGSLRLTIGQEEQHFPAESVRENIVYATPDSDGSYDEVVYCSYCNKEISRQQITVPFVVGDLDGDGAVADSDALRLYANLTDAETYPVNQNIDYNHDGTIDELDAVYLLNHTLLAERYALEAAETAENAESTDMEDMTESAENTEEMAQIEEMVQAD